MVADIQISDICALPDCLGGTGNAVHLTHLGENHADFDAGELRACSSLNAVATGLIRAMNSADPSGRD